MTPMRVLLAIESSGPGGAENVVVRLAEALRSAGEDPIVATLRPGWMTQRAEEAGLTVWIAPQRPGLDLPWIAAFAQRMRRERIDVLHSHEFAMNVFGGLAALGARVPAISTIHGRAYVSAQPRRVWAYRILRRLGIPIIAVSEDLAGFLADGFGLSRASLDVVHNGIPLRAPVLASERATRRAEARRVLRVPPDGPLLVAVGKLYPVKDHANLVRALAELPGARVAIAGRGDEEANLRRLAGELGVAERLHLLGLRDDVDTVLAAGDVFVQPSLSEGLPLAVLEAMAGGLPVVASRVGGIGEAVRDGETGYLVPSANPPALAAALRKVLESGDRGAALGAAGRLRAEREFSIAAMAERYRALYRAKAPSQRRSS
jgi:glycosyltransferase involved in cell wall biosynthesis